MKSQRIIVIALLMILFYGTGVTNFSEQNLVFEKPVNFKIQFTSLIIITNDDDLDQEALDQGWDGDGSKGDPFIIDNGYINAAGSTTLTLVNISNTQKYFVIEDSYLVGGGVAIYLENVLNGVIRNNWIENSSKAIDMRNCNNVNITTNDILRGNTAINFIDVSYCNINYNDIYGSNKGFNLLNCNDIAITSSTINGGGTAFDFDNVTKSNISDNWSNATSVGFSIDNGEYLDISFNTIQYTQNGIYIDKNSNNSRIDSNVINTSYISGIVLDDNSNDNNVTNNVITGVDYYGISIKGSNNNKIFNNTVDDIWSSTGSGLSLYYSSENKIFNNSISNGNKYGMSISSLSLDNEIAYNNITDTGELGIWIVDTFVTNNLFHDNRIVNHNHGIADEGEGNIYTQNYIHTGYSSGAYLTSNTTFTDNHIIGLGQFGIQLIGDNNTIEENFIEDCNYYGIYGYYGSVNNTLRANRIENSGFTALGLAQCANYTIVDNILDENKGDFYFYAPLLAHYYHEISNNFVNGKEIIYLKDTDTPYIPNDIGRVILINCSNFDVTGYTFENTLVGVLAVNCQNISISNNLFRFIYTAIELRNCVDVTIDNNEIYNCSGTGIWVLTGDNIGIHENLIHTSNFDNDDARAAVYLHNVHTGRVSRNTIFDNIGSGIRSQSSDNIRIYNNQIRFVSYGIYLNSDDYMTISNNRINNCTYGLYLISSFDGQIFGNHLINNTGYGIYMIDVEYFSIYLNNFIDNYPTGSQVEDISGTNNQFYRNYWSDHDIIDSNLDGFKDATYAFTSNSDNQSLAVPYLISTPNILTPNSDEVLNKTITITWESSIDTLGYNIVYYVYISYDGGQSWLRIGTDLVSTSLLWETPVHINSTNCLIIVRAGNEFLVLSDDISNSFTIINFGLTTPTIQFPSEDSTVVGSINIQWDPAIDLWNSSSSIKYTVFYSTDDGLTWHEIAVDIAATSSVWITEGLEDGTYLIKVIASTEEGFNKQYILSIIIQNSVTTTEPISGTTESITTETSTSVTSTTTSGFSISLLLGCCMIFILKRKKYF